MVSPIAGDIIIRVLLVGWKPPGRFRGNFLVGWFFGRVVWGSAAGRRIFGRGIQGQPQADLRCFRPKGETPRPQKISLNDTVLMHFLCVKQLFFNRSWWKFLVEGFRFWSGSFQDNFLVEWFFGLGSRKPINYSDYYLWIARRRRENVYDLAL